DASSTGGIVMTNVVPYDLRLLNRRAVVAGAAALIASTAARAQPAASGGGPRVWLDMDQRALDDAYDQSKYAPNLEQVTHRYAVNSEIVRSRLGPPRRVAYGPTPVEMLDIYAAKQPNAPVMVLVHGGAWRAGLAKNYAFAAENFVHARAHFVVLDFINVI